MEPLATFGWGLTVGDRGLALRTVLRWWAAPSRSSDAECRRCNLRFVTGRHDFEDLSQKFFLGDLASMPKFDFSARRYQN